MNTGGKLSGIVSTCTNRNKTKQKQQLCCFHSLKIDIIEKKKSKGLTLHSNLSWTNTLRRSHRGVFTSLLHIKIYTAVFLCEKNCFVFVCFCLLLLLYFREDFISSGGWSMEGCDR